MVRRFINFVFTIKEKQNYKLISQSGILVLNSFLKTALLKIVAFNESFEFGWRRY
jgi:hypothetical protein